MFKPFTISLNRVHDRVRISEGGEHIDLLVDDDPMRLVAGLSQAQKGLQAINSESTDEDQVNAAQYFAQVIFGKTQAEQLLAFYHNDAGCVINVCGRYFTDRLSKLITAAQKRMK